jgi:MSHA biogenesis protein MshP
MCLEDGDIAVNIQKQTVARMKSRSPDGAQRNPGNLVIAPGFHSVPSGLRKQRGISLIVVIFLLALVSVLAVSMVNLSGTQHMSSVYTVQGTQAYFAARSGLEYAIARIVVDGQNCGGIASPLSISGYDVNIACALAGNYDEGNAAAPYNIYRLTATASSGNFQAPSVVNRQITVTVKNP